MAAFICCAKFLAALCSGFDGFRPPPGLRARVLSTKFHLIFISITNYISCSRIRRVNFWSSHGYYANFNLARISSAFMPLISTKKTIEVLIAQQQNAISPSFMLLALQSPHLSLQRRLRRVQNASRTHRFICTHLRRNFSVKFFQ